MKKRNKSIVAITIIAATSLMITGISACRSSRDNIEGTLNSSNKAANNIQIENDMKETDSVQNSDAVKNAANDGEMRDISAMDLVKEMGVGINLGNTLDAFGGETNWGNPLTTQEMIDEIKKTGFNTVRIPVTWDDNLGPAPDFTINAKYMDRVEEVVNYVLKDGMYAIINIHHTNGWNSTNATSEQTATNELKIVWKQIADRFKGYGDHLIFEAMNEPRDDDNWVGYSEAYEILNCYNAAVVETIRATGGNNSKRLIMIPTYAASSDYRCVGALKIPEDSGRIAVSVHAYIPYNFAMDISQNGTAQWGSNEDKKYIEKVFQLLNKTFVSKGIPVVLGEFASTNKDNLDARVAHAEFFVKTAKRYGIPCIWWDNGNFTANTQDAMGIFNRRQLKWVFPEIVEAMFKGWNSTDNTEDDSENSDYLFEGEATSNGQWGQAVTLKPGIDFMPSDLKEGTIIAVEYQSDKVPELILQSWSGGENWAKVAPKKVENGIAYFYYDDMVASYKDATFEHLDALNIGDTGAPLKVTKIYYAK